MPDDHNWRKRHAVQIVAQLPEGIADARAVLALARELVEGFLANDQERAEILPFAVSASSR